MQINSKNRAVVLLCAYDSIVLHFTLQALTKTLDESETVVIILNGKRGIRSSLVEQVARNWAKHNPNHHIVRPLCAGDAAYNAIKEVLLEFEPLKNKEFICKMDDDLIPLKKGWLDKLHQTFIEKEKNTQVGFITSLINNNCWGFSELVNLYDKQNEYKQIMNHRSHSGTGIVDAGEIANGYAGTVWEYPYLARWCHEWTTLDLPNFIDKTENLGIKEVSLDTHYSIGCIFFRKNLWSDVESIGGKKQHFDELLIHLYCKKYNLRKFAVMNEPMSHLYYFIQRKPNADLIPNFAQSFADYWKDDVFLQYPKYDMDTLLSIQYEELAANLPQIIEKPIKEIPTLSNKWKKIRNKIRNKLRK